MLTLRQHKSRPIIERLHQWACEQRALPQSALGQAIKYMSNRWTGLTRFLTDPRVPLDNGATERAMRGLALGARITTAAGAGAVPRWRPSTTA
ncbi:transposase [Archangium sp.]|uniref:IS66 family transposase n=1 Tax=Archangium sp. TaxID=1872627 RepID=UPI00389A409B